MYFVIWFESILIIFYSFPRPKVSASGSSPKKRVLQSLQDKRWDNKVSQLSLQFLLDKRDNKVSQLVL